MDAISLRNSVTKMHIALRLQTKKMTQRVNVILDTSATAEHATEMGRRRTEMLCLSDQRAPKVRSARVLGSRNASSKNWCHCPTCSTPRMRVWLGSQIRSEEHTSELQSRGQLVCRLSIEQ